MLVLKFLCVQHVIFYFSKIHTSFSHSLTSILSGKNGKELGSLCICSGYLTSTLRKYPTSLS